MGLAEVEVVQNLVAPATKFCTRESRTFVGATGSLPAEHAERMEDQEDRLRTSGLTRPAFNPTLPVMETKMAAPTPDRTGHEFVPEFRTLGGAKPS